MRQGIVYDLPNMEASRASYWAEKGWTFGDWQFLPATGEVCLRGVVIAHLTETEAETLHLLIKIYPLMAPRAWIVREMRRVDCYWHIDTVKVVIRRVRRKLGTAVIETKPRGYQFNPKAILQVDGPLSGC